MAGFKTHISVSCGIGAAYGAVGSYMGLPTESCLVAAGIFGLAGVLPDLDSKTGVPVRETMALTAAAVPALMIDRFQALDLSNERIVLLIVGMYLVIRFGVGELFKRYTIHRGMWHSIPAALTIGCVVYLMATGISEEVRYFKAAAACLGFLTHLILDEIWSVELNARGVHLKRSSGTALKMFGKHKLATVVTYAKLFLVVWLAWGDFQASPNGQLGDPQNLRLAAPLNEADSAIEKLWR